MKRIIVFLLAATLSAAMAPAQQPEKISFKTRDGREFKDVSISSTTPESINVETDSGFERIAISNLPEDLQRRLNYDPAKAADYTKREAEIRAATAARKRDMAAREARFSEWVMELNKIRNNAGRSTDPDAGLAVKNAEEIYRSMRSIVDDMDARGVSDEMIRKTLHAALYKEVFVGMPASAARIALGAPRTANETTTAAGTSQQWVYGNSYLYIENGRVTAIQN